MSFHDERYPLGLAFGASGGPERRVDVVTLANGHEERNALWAGSRRRYEAGLALRSDDDLHALLGFFEARGGKLHGFRFRDWIDWKSCPPLASPGPLDQLLGSGDGVTAAFALVKLYPGAGGGWTRRITRPVAGSVRVARDGVEATTGFAVAAAGGSVVFDSPPAPGVIVTAGFEFDVPVRFDLDHLVISLADFRAGQVPSVPLVEVLE